MIKQEQEGGIEMELYFPLVLDGANGTELQKRGYDGSICTETWVLEHPEVMMQLQKEYIEAGSNVIYAPTFGANRVKLEENGIFNQVADYNKRLVAVSREAAEGTGALVAGDIATTGKFLAPVGDVTFDELYDIYHEQAEAIADAGADMFVIETIMTVPDARAALLAVRDVTDKPVLVSFTCDEKGRTLTGSDVLAAMVIMQGMEADAFGHDTIVVVRDHKLWQKQMHLDTHFNIIDKDLCTMVSSRLNAQPGSPEYNTCDIWARKPGTKEYTLWKQDQPFVEYMHGRGFQIIPIDYDDEMHYANNFLTIAPRHIMAVGGQSEELQQRLSDAGVNVEWIPLDNLIGGYGAAHCMTQVLQREVYNLDETPTGVRSRSVNAKNGAAYRLNGTFANESDRGIIIQDSKKSLRILGR